MCSGMVMYANEVETKEKEKLPEIKKLTTTYINHTPTYNVACYTNVKKKNTNKKIEVIVHFLLFFLCLFVCWGITTNFSVENAKFLEVRHCIGDAIHRGK